MLAAAVRVVKPGTLARLLGGLPAVGDTDVWVQLAPVICGYARAQRVRDITVYMEPVFRAWRKSSKLHPKPSFPANILTTDGLREFTHFAGRVFVRYLNSAGVVFATFLVINGSRVGVVWTTARKAYLFAYRAEGWAPGKVLERQGQPFLTWMRHLGGAELYAQEPMGEGRYEGRTPQQLFYDHVTPYYGAAAFTRPRFHMPPLPDDHATCHIVRRASELTLPADHHARYVWHEFRC